MQWDPSPCPHLPCASRWWDGAGPTCYLVSLASCLYLRLGSMNTWPAGYVPGRGWGGGGSSWARATCGVVECQAVPLTSWGALCKPQFPCSCRGAGAVLRDAERSTAGAGWSFLPPLLLAARRTRVQWEVGFSANLSASLAGAGRPPLHRGPFGPKAHGFGVRKLSSESLLCGQPAVWPWAHHLTSGPPCPPLERTGAVVSCTSHCRVH